MRVTRVLRSHLGDIDLGDIDLQHCSNVTDIMILYVNVLVALVDRLILDRVDRAWLSA